MIDAESLMLPFNVTVERMRLSGANYFGRPIAEEVNGPRGFSNFDEMLSYMNEYPQYSYAVKVPLPALEMKAGIRQPRLKDRPYEERLLVKVGDKVFESPRTVEGHHSISTDFKTHFDICINLGVDQGVLFDRGLAWISMDINSNTNRLNHLVFNFNAGIHTKEELETGMSKLGQRVNEVLNDLLNGTPVPEERYSI